MSDTNPNSDPSPVPGKAPTEPTAPEPETPASASADAPGGKSPTGPTPSALDSWGLGSTGGGTAKKAKGGAQPKIVQRQAVRTLALVIVLGALYLGYQKWRDVSQDYSSVATADTKGWVCGLQYANDGQEAVAFTPKGEEIKSPGWKTGNTDRDITWQPNGNRIFFVSDREDNNFHVYRWNPTDGSDPVKRTIGTRSRSNPEFPREPVEDADATALIVSGGFVLEYTPKDMSTRQVLPPIGREVTNASEEEGGGSSSQFSGAYSELGTSFRVARWCKGKTWIAAIMLRDQGELLVLQKMEPTADGKFPKPVPVAAGEHIDFDVNPKDGTLVVAVQDFQWPIPEAVPAQFRKGNRVTRPFAHTLIQVDPDGSEAAIAASIDDDHCFGQPAISPDGATIVFQVGTYAKSQGLMPVELYTAPDQRGGIKAGSPLVNGQVYEPSWSPDGELIAFAKKDEDGKRHLYTAHKDGSSLVDLTGAAGDFGQPHFSPQKASG